MIKNIIPDTDTHFLSRPTEPEIRYRTFISFDDRKLLGAGGQNPINAGSSMITDTPNMEATITQLISNTINNDCYLKKYIHDNNLLLEIASKNLILFKKDKRIRNIILNKIFIRENRQFTISNYSGYIFIIVSIYFLLNKTLKWSSNRDLLNRYFSDEENMKEQIINQLYDAEEIENLTAFCEGRFYFVDSKLTTYQDKKPTLTTIISKVMGE
ncbi:hypothetical protein [Aliarcobacter butzleri]|uniref:hypothetical protein n=1 Tax=Aliarcobacter butzleri TaxID=28197 RepID=UPI0021B3ED80|nr:hypothetical protein [Aliarcobacter butzleri]MCT7615658.1 hypothetical protein [Aliarcobacter butzleri]